MDLEKYLNLALEEARKAFDEGNFPVGAVLVRADGEVIAGGHNMIESTKDLTSHAEINAIRRAGLEIMSNYDTADNWLFTTLEPCFACSFLITRASLRHAVWALKDINKGGIDDLLQTPKLGPDLRALDLIVEPSLDCRRQSSELIQEFYKRQGKFELAKKFE